MNAMVGGGIMALVAGLKRKQNPVFGQLALELSKLLTFLIAFAINLGVAPLLFMQVLYGHFFYVSSVLMAVIWLMVIGLLLLAYYGAYFYKFRFEQLGGKRQLIIGITVGLFFLIGFIFSNNMTLMLRPERWIAYFSNPHGTFLNITEPTLWPRFLHFMVASVAVGGLMVAFSGHLKRKNDADCAKTRVAWGLHWFAHATIVQIGIGFWFLISLPANIRILFLGGNIFLSALLLMGIAASVMALISGLRGKLGPAVTTTLFTIMLMILIRDQVRNAYLEPFFKLSDLALETQYGSLALFLVALAISLGAMLFLVRLVFTSGQKPSVSSHK
jgi:hypothetical protein